MNPEGAALSKLIDIVTTLGPRNIPNIASELSIPIETARHRLKRQILERGIRIHASIDFGKLDLQRAWAFLDFTDEYRGQEAKVAKALADVAFLTHYARTMPEEKFLVQFGIPRSKIVEHERFLSGLVKNGILKGYEMHRLSWMRHISMKTAYYNFKTRVCEIDWEALDRLRHTPESPAASPAQPFDKKDLLILKELQADSSIQFVDMSKKLGIDVKTLLYHYHTHVKNRGFVTKYLVRWRGDRKNLRRYAVLPAKAWIRNLSQNELLVVQEVFSRLPFTWSDSYSSEDGFYLADLEMALVHYSDTLSFIQRNLGASKRRLEIAIVDQQCTSTFTIPYHMFEEDRGWIFDAEVALDRFRVITTTERVDESLKNRGEL